MQEKHFFILHYNEDRKFINILKEKKYPVTVYHKGNDPQPGDIHLPNYGTGDWVVFKHIVDNYDNLPEYTIFSQANPDDHVHEFLLAIESTLTSGYGSFSYARSFHSQYREEEKEYYPAKLILDKIGIKYHNDTNARKFLYWCHPGNIFYLSRERIRQRPKEFYQNIIDLELDDYLLANNLMVNTDHPPYFNNNLFIKHKDLRHLNNKARILKLMGMTGKSDLYFSCTIEPLYWHIFADIKLLEKLKKSEMTTNNKLYFDVTEKTYTGKTFNLYPFNHDSQRQSLNFKLLENDWFDWNCPNYLKWREKLIEKTIWEGEQRGFDGRQLLEFYERVGYKHISL